MMRRRGGRRIMFDQLSRHFYGLIVFKAAVDFGSLNRAALSLKITQPAVTRNISRLEEVLGMRLLQRKSTGVVPTDFGKAILGYVDAAAKEIRLGGQSLTLMHRTRRNAVACAGSTVTMMIVASAAHRFHKDRSEQSLRLIEGTTPAMLDMLLAGELDFVVGSHIHEEIDEQLVAEPLLDEQLGVFAARNNPLHQSAPLKIADLFQTESWIVPDAGTHLHAYIREILKTTKLSMPKQLIESRSISAIRWMVQNTNCISLSTSLVHLPELMTGEVAVLPTDWSFPVTKHTIYRRPLRMMSRAALDLIKEIKIEAKTVSARQMHFPQPPTKSSSSLDRAGLLQKKLKPSAMYPAPCKKHRIHQ